MNFENFTLSLSKIKIQHFEPLILNSHPYHEEHKNCLVASEGYQQKMDPVDGSPAVL